LTKVYLILVLVTNFFALFVLHFLSFRQKIAEEKRKCENLERDHKENETLRHRLMERDHELQTMTTLRQQALAEAERSKEVMHDLRNDAENARNQAQRAQGEVER